VKFDISAIEGASRVGRAETAANCKGRKATGCVTKDQLLGAMLSDGSAGRRVRIQAPGGDAHQAGGEASSPPSKRKGRKATGGLTKEQLLAVLQPEEDDDGSEGDSRQGTRGKRVTISAPEKADTSDESDGSPVARKATGCVTKQQLLAIEMQDDGDDERSSEDKEDQPAKKNVTVHAPSALHFASSLFDGTCGMRVTIAAPENADNSGKIQPAPEREGRTATGVPTKQQLLAALQQEERDGDEGDDEPGNSSAKQGGGMRSGGVAGPKRGVGGSERRVRLVPPEDTDKSDESDGPPVARKATGCATKQQLLAIAMQDDSDDEQSSEDKEDQPAKKNATMHAPGPKHTDDRNVTWESSANRNGTGSVPRKYLGAGQPKVRFDTKEEVSEFPVLLTAPRRRGRKATGAATKEQLLEAMSASGQGGGVAFADAEGDEEAFRAVRKRCAGRKGTAFVPAAQSEPLLVEEGADKTAALPAGWLCCTRP